MVKNLTVTSLPHSLFEINQLAESEKLEIYTSLIPDWVAQYVGLNDIMSGVNSGTRPNICLICPDSSRTLELAIYRKLHESDPVVYLHIMDTLDYQIAVLLAVVNDLDSPRFDIDVDDDGNETQFGTRTRNITAEIAAMNAGLAPGQIRKGLRVFRKIIPVFETFLQRMGHDIFLIEPLSYHNAILFERYGFNYLVGKRRMGWIDAEFVPGGELYRKLDESTPFRHKDASKCIRGRSWAIHDGILGRAFSDFRMYKQVGVDAGVRTTSEVTW